MNDDDKDFTLSRRGALECMLWAGTGVLWTVAGGVPTSRLIGGASAADQASEGFSFIQMSDSHVGFSKPANPDARGTLKEAIAKIADMPKKPSFIIHTGDITHLSKAGPVRRCGRAHRRGEARCALCPGRTRHHR